ncbi:MAG: DUF5753 domain-containing protein [Actinomycetota bacterium]|nr:DUF5753 domain-containing protein [Actinomycetota bacterium]
MTLDEAALRRPLGDQKGWRAQLLHLIEMAQRPNITLQIVPFDTGGHTAAGGPFTILRFSNPTCSTSSLAHLTNALYLDKMRDTVHYLAIMDYMCIQAESPWQHKLPTQDHQQNLSRTKRLNGCSRDLATVLSDRSITYLRLGPPTVCAGAGAGVEGFGQFVV